MIITRTPYRLSLFGGGADFFEWYNENPTTVIVAAMDYYGYVLVTRKPKFFPEYISKIAYSDIEYVAKYRHKASIGQWNVYVILTSKPG